MNAKDHQPLPHPSMKKEVRAEAKLPKWVTSWPDWYGISDNVTVVPFEDYQRAATDLARLTAENEALRKKHCCHQWEKVDYGLYRCVGCAAIKEGS